jgi:acyl-CoA synthetase (NDP forming)
MHHRLSVNPVDLGPVLSVSADPFAVQEEVITTVLHDPNVDCAAISVYVGFDEIVPPLLEMFDRLKEHLEKPVALWIYGMKLHTLDEMFRQLEARNLPTYLDFELAVKALGFATRYSRIKAGQG